MKIGNLLNAMIIDEVNRLKEENHINEIKEEIWN